VQVHIHIAHLHQRSQGWNKSRASLSCLPYFQGIFNLTAFDPDYDNLTFMMGTKHAAVFKVEDSRLYLSQEVDYESRSFYSIDVS